MNYRQQSCHSELVSEFNTKKKVKQGYVYIMSNPNRTTLYIGVTNNIEKKSART